MSEGSITVEELAEKADEYLHETSLTPEDYEALKLSVAELAPIFSADRAYFVLGTTASRRFDDCISSRTGSTGGPMRTPS